MTALGFKKATKTQARARVALSGPPGSGKTYTALTWAAALGKTIGLIDTERSSASLYADLFDFDTLAMTPPYHPRRLIDALALAADYDVTVIDSASHYWAGEGGVLEIVDQAKAGLDNYRAWSKGTPLQQRMVDAILSHPGHVIITMRSKVEYAIVQGSDGKKHVEKLGLAPVQRDGIEYEFTLIADIDMGHVAHVTKSRFSGLADADIPVERTVAAAREFSDWLTTGAPMPEPVDRAALAALAARLSQLPADVADVVRARWSVAALPHLASIVTQADLLAATELVDAVLAPPAAVAS